MLTTDFGGDPRRPVDRARRRGDGRDRAAGELRARAARRRASRSSRRTSSSSRATATSCSRPRPRTGSSSASRPRVCAAIPVIKLLRESLVVRERPPHARDRQRHHQLHPHADGGAAPTTRRRSPRPSGSATPRPTPPTTSAAPTRPRRWRSSPPSPSARACRSTTSRTPGSTPSTSLHVAAARELEMVVRLVGAATLIDDRYDVRVQPVVRRPPPSARRRRGRVQRRDAAGRRDPRDHARGAGRGRDGDGLRGRGRHGQRDRHDRHRLPPERPLLARRSSACRPGELRSPFYVHLEVDDRPGVLAVVAQRLAGAAGLGRPARAAAARRRRLAAHRAARGAGRGRSRPHSPRSPSCPETRQAPVAIPVISDRGVPELGWA